MKRTTKVGSYRPNAFGLHDMHGNVAEWCQDWFGPYVVDIVDDPVGSAGGSRRVARGGFWLAAAWGCRSAHRGGSAPTGRAGNLGFRVAMPAAIVFRKGHRIRIHVQSSCWPLWDRNQNTGNPIGMDAQVQVARQTIYHDASQPI